MKDFNLLTSAFYGHTHYSLAMSPDTLAQWAIEAAAALPEYLDGKAPVFCYSGMSGVAHSTALVMEYHKQHGADFGQVYVRKRGETSHGYHVETGLVRVRSRQRRLVFVDDFVSSGSTRDYTIKKALGLAKVSCDLDRNSYVQCTGRDLELMHFLSRHWLG